MERTLIFATNNRHKIEEIRPLLPAGIRLITLQEAGIHIDIPEPHDTLEANAREKSQTIFRLTGSDCFSEDTGLEVEALHGAPGVHSARYAGEDRSFAANIDKLLHNLQGVANRRARFRTVVSLQLGGREYQFEGICPGHITEAPAGSGGFGYDPVFVPEGSDRCFADMSVDEKNQYSHRRKAIDRLIAFLNQYHGQN